MGSRKQRSYTEQEQYQALLKVAEFGGNVHAAARALGIPCQTLVVWVKKRGVELRKIHKTLKRELAQECSFSAVLLAEKIGEGIDQLALDGPIETNGRKIIPTEIG